METSDAHDFLLLSPRVFRLCWCFLIGYHLFNALFAALLAFSHLIIGSPAVYRNIWMLAVSQRTLVIAGWSYAVVAAFQLLIVARHVLQSLREMRLSFGNEATSASTSASAFQQRITDLLARWKPNVLKNTTEVMFELRQLVEIVLQTYQANQISRSVSRPDLQAFVVVVIVVNCVHTPLLDAFLWRRHSRPSARLVIINAIDIWLDFLIAVVLPICLLVRRLREFDFELGQFPTRLTYNDVWSTMAINEGRQVLVTSSLDYVSSILPHVVGIVSLSFIKSKLRRRSGQIAPHGASGRQVNSVSEGFLALRPEAKAATSSSSSMAQIFSGQSKGTNAVLKIIHLIAFGWAILVVCLHVQAQRWNTTVIEGCLVVFPAWLASRSPCAALLFNCHARGRIAGSSQQIQESLAIVERSVLGTLIFSHCPALEIPPIMTREFSHLSAIGMFNSTIKTWDISAAITHRHTPTLALLQLLHTNMSGIPEGFAHPDMPPVLSLNMYGSNLSSLPETIGDTWGKVDWSTMWLEYTQLTALPNSFSQVRATKLSFEGSPLASLPSQLLHQPFSLVRLSETKLQELPLASDDTSRLATFLAENTSVLHVPDWLRSWAVSTGDCVVSLRGSPACELNPVENAVLCQAVNPIQRNSLPYDIIAAQRPLEAS